MVQHLVEGGFKTIRAIESSAAGDLLGLPWFDLKQMSLLRQGLDLYNRAEALGEVDYS